MSEELDLRRARGTMQREGWDLEDLAEQILMRRFDVDSAGAHAHLMRAAHRSRTTLLALCTRVCEVHFGVAGDLPGAVGEQVVARSVAEFAKPDVTEQLRRLAELRDAGFLTNAQYELRREGLTGYPPLKWAEPE